MTPWKWVQEKGTWASAKANYKGAKPNVDPLVRHLGTLLEGDAGFLTVTIPLGGAPAH